jgi:hypothetical protein
MKPGEQDEKHHLEQNATSNQMLEPRHAIIRLGGIYDMTWN